ncbi:MAG: hypothetical protein CMN74_02400 [Sphingorhabdus sp.]|nr:hypothetical protein [Sphingorhabdus sp.]
MREYVRAGEIAAILGMDSKTSEWAIWNRMTEDEEDSDIGDRSRWQGRLASEIASGIAKDHGITIAKALEPKIGEGIMPPRAWEISPHTRTNGKPGVLIVMQRTQNSLFGWEAPTKIPEKPLMRFIGAAIAYGYDYAYVGILVDGYRSELYRIEVEPDTRQTVIAKVAEMIEMVRTDDEPVVDYDADRSAIVEGKASVKAEASGESIEKLLTERDEKKALITNLNNQANTAKKRVEQIEAMIIAAIPEGDSIDTGNRIVGVERNKKDKLELKIADKKKDVASLF